MAQSLPTYWFIFLDPYTNLPFGICTIYFDLKVYTLDLPPTQDASHHEDYEPFLLGNLGRNLYLPTMAWRIPWDDGIFTHMNHMNGDRFGWEIGR